MSRLFFWLLVLALPALSQWRTGYFMQGEAGGQTAATIPWPKYTHVVHYAVQPTYSNGVCGLAPGTDISEFVNGAHAAGVKAILGIVEDEAREAISACTTPENIGQFVDAIRNFAANHQYDGVDIDWKNGIITAQYQDLIRQLRAAMPTAVLSVAVGLAERFMTAELQHDLDQINIRVYDLDFTDLSGSAINYTWYHAATLQGGNTQDQAMDILFRDYVYAGNAANKLGLIVPFYGRIRKGCLDSTGAEGVTGPNQAWVGGAWAASMGYRDLVNSTIWSIGAQVWDDSRKSQYIQYRSGSCSTDAFISFVGPEQLREIAALIKTNGLGGIATYGMAYEYAAQEVGDTRYPLSSAMYDAMAAAAGVPAAGQLVRPSSALARASVPGSGSPNARAGQRQPSIVTTSPLPSAVTGAAYSRTLVAAGRTPITWAVTSGTLPAGLSLGSSTGLLSGTPTAAGVSTFTVRATNAAGSNSKQLSLTVNAAPTRPSIVTTSPLPSALTGAAYSQTLTATGTTPITWAVTGGTLPAGLSLGSSTGVVSGTPTAAGVFTFTVRATNAGGSKSKQFSLTVNAAPTPPSIVTTSPLPSTVTGTACSRSLVATGTTPITWAVTSGALPAGLTLGSSTGLLSGTPTAAGVSTFTVSAANAGGSNSKQLSLTVNAAATPPSIVTTSPLPSAVTGAVYAQALAATGTTPITWAVTGGALPVGLTLGSATGVLSGTPTAAGAVTLTVSATNAGGSNSKQLSLTVNVPATPPSIVTTSPLPNALTGAAYAQALAATGTTPITWAVTSGTLPAGVSLGSATGILSGTPMAAGVATFIVSATNAVGSNSKQLSLTVDAAATPPACCTYYVDNAGDDAKDGRTPTTAWRTVAKVNRATLQPGQSVGFKRGGMWRETLTVANSGIAGSPITFTAYESGASPIINGSDAVTGFSQVRTNVYNANVGVQPSAVWFDGVVRVTKNSAEALTSDGDWFWSSSLLFIYSTSDPSGRTIEASARARGVWIRDKSWVVVENLQFANVTTSPIGVVSTTDSLLRNNTIACVSGTGVGIGTTNGRNNTMSGNAISNCQIGIKVLVTSSGTATGSVVSGNTVNACGHRGISIIGDPSVHETATVVSNTTFNNGDGIYLDYTDGSAVAWNISYGNNNTTKAGEGYGIGVSGSSRNTVANNHLYSNRTSGIELSTGEDLSTPSSGNIVRHNVIHDNGWNGVFTSAATSIDNEILYNIVYNHTANGFANIMVSGSGHKLYHNTLYNGYRGIFLYDSSATGVMIENNIISTNISHHIYVMAGAGGTFDYNIYFDITGNKFYWQGASYAFGVWRTNSSQDADSLAGDPVFTNAAAGDFTPQAGSPALAGGVYIPGVSTANPPNIGAE